MGLEAICFRARTLLEFLRFLPGRTLALETKERVLNLEHELLALVLFAFADALDFKGELASQLVRFQQLFLEVGDVLLVLLDVAEQEQHLPDSLSDLLEYGGGWPKLRQGCAG
jgi:hypothetical protein